MSDDLQFLFDQQSDEVAARHPDWDEIEIAERALQAAYAAP